MPAKSFPSWIFLGLFFFAFLIVFALWNRKDVTVGMGEEVQFDDFGYVVENLRSTDSLGPNGERKPMKGRFYILSLKVINHALRVPYKFDPEILVLSGSDGWEVAADPAQQLGGCEEELAPGSSCRREIVFDAPANLPNAQVCISMGKRVMMLDLLDFVFWGTRKIKLS